MKKKYEIVFDEHNKISLAIPLGIFYEEDDSEYDSFSDYQKIRLFTLCYRPRYHDFVQISDIGKLPKRLRDRYQNAYKCKQTLEELEGIGIHDFRQIRGE